MKRDSKDIKWQETKKIVRQRDNNSCRLMRILTPTEYFLLKKKAGSLLSVIDPAHFISVSERPDLCYISENIVCLNRYSHEQLDSYRDPITGKPISALEHLNWWIRILKGNSSQWNYLLRNHLIENEE